MLDIRLDHLVRHRPRRGTEVTPCPQVAAPVPTLQLRKLLLEQPRRTTLDVLNTKSHRQPRWNRCEQVDMIPTHVTFDNRNVLGHANLTDRVSGSNRNLTREHRIPILRYPHHVVLDIVDRVGTVTIFGYGHPSSLPQEDTLKRLRLKAKVSTPMLE